MRHRRQFSPLGRIETESGPRFAALFGDSSAVVYAVDASTGTLLWKTKVDDHLAARITGSPAFHQPRLYVPVASIEEGSATMANYECCRFRGSVVALDGATGKRLWKTYTVAEAARPTKKNKSGTQQWGPSGAPCNRLFPSTAKISRGAPQLQVMTISDSPAPTADSASPDAGRRNRGWHRARRNREIPIRRSFAGWQEPFPCPLWPRTPRSAKNC
jgi:hypothetical protein